MEGKGSVGRRQQNVRVFPSQVVRPRDRRSAPDDCRLVDDYVYLTIHLPHIEDAELRYSIRRRYILVWGESSVHDDQRLIMLPKPVDPDQHSVRFQNGVFDVRVKLAPKK